MCPRPLADSTRAKALRRVTSAPAIAVIGPPTVARVAAVTAVVAAILIAAAAFPAYATIGGQSADSGVADRIAGLLWPLSIIAAAGMVLAGRKPRFGLAFLGVTGGLGPGLVLQKLYAWQPVPEHRAVEVVAGRRLVTSTFDPGLGAALGLAGAVVLVFALVLTLVAWPRMPVEDDGGFDGRRQVALGVAAFAGLLGVLAVSARGIAAPALVQRDAIGFRTTVEVAADVAVLERFGLDRAGGLLLAVGVVLGALIAAGLRPRLAVVGALAGLAAWAMPTGLVLVLQAARFDDVVPGLGAWLFLLCGLVFGGLAGWAAAVAPRELGSDLFEGGPAQDTLLAGLPPDRDTARGGSGDD